MQAWLIAPAKENAAQRTRAEAVVRELQTHAARHGELLEGLLPDMQQFDSLWKVQQPREERVSGLFNDAIDLFGRERRKRLEQPQVARDAGQQAHAMWINHLRQWSRNEENAARLGLSSATVRQMAEILIISSYKLNYAGAVAEDYAARYRFCGAVVRRHW